MNTFDRETWGHERREDGRKVVLTGRYPVTGGQDWTFDHVDDMYLNIERIWQERYGISFYTNQIEIISSEQMLDAYAASGLPIMYDHWSFGKDFVEQTEMYRRGYRGLAYEIVINSSPCISYCMEENSMLMQTLVMAHAAFGHNSFFKNNYMFKQWTDAESIIDYLVFAKGYIRSCEEEHGPDRVEELLDAAHALMRYGVDKYQRPPEMSVHDEKERAIERERVIHENLNVLWSTIPKTANEEAATPDEDKFPTEPQENLLYFIEKNAPRLEQWEREILRIVRKIAQYFYPQMQTKLMNEGWASFWHYQLMHDLNEEGLIDDGGMMEFYESHTGVVMQPDFDDPRYNGINVYALGFAMFQDIKRISDPEQCTDEDRKWFPSWAGNGDWLGNVTFAMENFKDESFVSQYLSPAVARKFRLFNVYDDEKDPQLEITQISSDRCFRDLRTKLAAQFNLGYHLPDIQVTDVNRWGDRTMTLGHFMVNGRPLEPKSATEVLKHVSHLWGYRVRMESLDYEGKIRACYDVTDEETLLDVFLDDD